MTAKDIHPSLTCYNDPSRPVYFGTPGSLVEIMWPRGGIIGTRTYTTSEFRLGVGDTRVSRQASTKRRYILEWDALIYSNWTQLWAYEQGHNGVGPWVLLDPNIVNMLSVNQSSTTSLTNDTTGFSCSTPVSGTGEGITSSNALVNRGPRSVKWSFASGAAGTYILTVDSVTSFWYGVPVYIGDSYVFSGQLRGAGTDAIIDVTFQIWWYTVDGTFISTSSGTPVTTAAGAWSQAYVADVAPATAAFGLCRVSVDSATISAGSILYIDELQLEVGTVPSTWRPGVGVYPTVIISLTPDHHIFYTGLSRVESPTLTLQEVDL